jgi:hypothetical protein
VPMRSAAWPHAWLRAQPAEVLHLARPKDAWPPAAKAMVKSGGLFSATQTFTTPRYAPNVLVKLLRGQPTCNKSVSETMGVDLSGVWGFVWCGRGHASEWVSVVCARVCARRRAALCFCTQHIIHTRTPDEERLITSSTMYIHTSPAYLALFKTKSGARRSRARWPGTGGRRCEVEAARERRPRH